MSSRKELDANVSATLEKFFDSTLGAPRLLEKAIGTLVFPSIVKVGILGVGGQFGEGALLVKGVTEGYYNTVSASIGFQLGLQAYSTIIVFLTQEALDSFIASDGWKVGVDASVAVIKLGMGAKIDTDNIQDSIVAFIFDNEGLMYSLSLEGTKISRIAK
jgi:lipid-binding SYLF domain-containing protein